MSGRMRCSSSSWTNKLRTGEVITNNKTKKSVCVYIYMCVCGKFPNGLIRKTVRVTGLVFSV